jgi:hypothetical protein
VRAAAVLGRRFRPEVAAQLAGLAAADAAAAQEAFATSGLGREEADGWAEFGHELIRQAIYELAAPVRAQLHETAFRVLAARGILWRGGQARVAARLAGPAGRGRSQHAQAERRWRPAPWARPAATWRRPSTWPGRPRRPS